MNGLRRVLAFSDYLRSQRMPFHIGQCHEDAVRFSFGTFGNRFTLDFYEDRIRCERYGGAEDLRTDFGELHAMINAGAKACRLLPRAQGVGAEGGNAVPDGLRRLLDFTSHLRAKGVHHNIEQHSSEALEVNFMMQRRRFEVEFSADNVLYCVFDEQAGSVLDEAAIRREVEVHARPYHPAMQLRNEWRCAAE